MRRVPHSLLSAVTLVVLLVSCENKKGLERQVKEDQEEVSVLLAKRKDLDRIYHDANREITKLTNSGPSKYQIDTIENHIASLQTDLESLQGGDAVATEAAKAAQDRLESYNKKFGGQ